jgi:hypothetical protein
MNIVGEIQEVLRKIGLVKGVPLSTKPVLSDHLSYVTIFHCSLGRSHKTGLTVLG